MKPRVSVLMPVRDAEDTVGEAIKSILRQTERNFELLVVDDGSYDATPAVLRDFAGMDERVRVLSTEGCGIVAALNLAVSEAAANLLARMDADDVAHSRRLELQCAFLDANPEVGMVACRVEHWNPDGGSRPGFGHYVDWTNALLHDRDLQLRRFVESPLAHPSVVFRKGLVEWFGGYRNGPFPEDYELWLRWFDCGVQMEKLSENLLRWRDHDRRLSRIDPRYSTSAFYRMKLEYLHKWLDRHNRFHPEVKVWGAGRTTRSRAKFLEEAGTVVTGYYDVDPKKIGNPRGGLDVRSIADVPEPGEEFIVCMVGARGAREKALAFLNDLGHREGVDFILAA